MADDTKTDQKTTEGLLDASQEANVDAVTEPGAPETAGEQIELDLLRSELSKMQTALAQAKTEAGEMKDKYLRTRAELENYRRRVTQDLERAREAGLESAVLPVLTVYDDLERALSVSVDDPNKIIPGIESVRDGLKRNLESLGIKEVGSKGERFDPDFHEALSSLPCPDEALSGTIAEVFQVGFVKNEKLVRPARVVVYQN